MKLSAARKPGRKTEKKTPKGARNGQRSIANSGRFIATAAVSGHEGLARLRHRARARAPHRSPLAIRHRRQTRKLHDPSPFFFPGLTMVDWHASVGRPRPVSLAMSLACVGCRGPESRRVSCWFRAMAAIQSNLIEAPCVKRRGLRSWLSLRGTLQGRQCASYRLWLIGNHGDGWSHVVVLSHDGDVDSLGEGLN